MSRLPLNRSNGHRPPWEFANKERGGGREKKGGEGVIPFPITAIFRFYITILRYFLLDFSCFLSSLVVGRCSLYEKKRERENQSNASVRRALLFEPLILWAFPFSIFVSSLFIDAENGGPVRSTMRIVSNRRRANRLGGDKLKLTAVKIIIAPLSIARPFPRIFAFLSELFFLLFCIKQKPSDL